MLNLKNDIGSLKELVERKKRVVLYGAGASARLLLKSYYDILPGTSLEFIIDGNEALDGEYCVIDENRKVRIISLRHFCRDWSERIQEFTLLFTPYFSLFIIRELDRIEVLNQVEAYVYSFIVNRIPPGPFAMRSTDKPQIPKKIHYFWLGGSKLPEEYEKNMESWRRFCPDYEIIRWDESNYDFSKFRYAREALESRQYMYATDVARKDVLYTYGGIYFDTDVELLRSIDDLLYHEAFIGIDDGGQLNSGSGLGCVRHHPVMKEMLELYRDKAFIKGDGSFNLHYNTLYETELMIGKGYRIKNEYQMIGGVSCLPREVLMPRGTVGVKDSYTVNTLSDHKINPYDRGPVEPVRNRLYGEIALYGAGMVAVSVYYAIKTLYPDCRIMCFIVSEKNDNPDRIGQVPVLSQDEFCRTKEKEQVTILVAAPENHHQTIIGELKKRNLRDVICMDSRREAVLMEHYYERTKQFPSLHSYHRKGPEGKTFSLKVYMAKFHKDQPLKNSWEMPGWLTPIQAGAALTEISAADIKDNTGDNISEKNSNYSELSALYWIWKNEEHGKGVPDYLGLFHYRRILDVTEEDIACMTENGIDVILPYPTIHYPTIDEHHRRYVKSQDWEAMILALEELEPEYARAMPEIFAQPYFYNYNMFIARREIFDEFCGWLFPILKRTEELSTPKGWERADRYIGYLGENLTTLYFMYHKNDLKAAHTGRMMLV